MEVLFALGLEFWIDPGVVGRFEDVLLDTIEEGHHGKVISLGDGVSFVVVALAAVEGDAEEGFSGDVDDVSDGIGVGLGAVGGFVVALHEGHEAGGDEGVEGFVGELVAGELFEEKAVVGFVLVEGFDDVVAVAPDLGLLAVAFEAVGLGVADKVEPMRGKLFAKAG